MSLRLSPDLADRIAAVARVEGISISEAVRAAINARVADRMSAPEFQERLRAFKKEEMQALERLLSDVG